MALESDFSHLRLLNSSNPSLSDSLSQADDHLRGIKTALKGTFTGIDTQGGNTAVTATATELNILDGATLTTSELNTLDGVTSTAAEINVLDGIPAGLTATELGYVDGVTSAIQTQLDTKAPLASPTLTGTPLAPTAAAGTNTTQIATTAYVQTHAPSASDTVAGLVELATAAQVKSGTASGLALTPANLIGGQVRNSTTATGTGKLALGNQGSIEIAGVHVKWGYLNNGSDDPTNFTFQTAFPNFCSVVLLTRADVVNATSPYAVKAVEKDYFTIDRHGGIDNPDGKFYFIAIGG